MAGTADDWCILYDYFDAVYDGMRAGFLPHIPIITAGLAPTVDTEESRDDRAYLQELYNAGLATTSCRLALAPLLILRDGRR